MSRLAEFYRAHPEQAPYAAVPELAAGAQQYRQRQGLPGPAIPGRLFSGVEVDPTRGRAIAAAYDAMPDYDPAAEPAFEAMRQETGRQFEFMTGSRSRGGLGIDVGVVGEDPYGGPQDMVADLREGRMKVLSSQQTGGHPFFDTDENDMFRAVHDAFGHAGAGRGFDRHGEEAAWLSHSSMYTPAARPAMTSETRGQNSSFIFTGEGKVFPPQKVAILPKQYRDPLTVVTGRRSGGRAALGQQFGGIV